MRVGEEGEPWAARAVPNLFPLADIHEVLVPTPHHATSTRELSTSEWEAALTLWLLRSRHHAPRYADGCYVHLLVNDGKGAGASLEHTHAQLLVVPETPWARALYEHCLDEQDCAACRVAQSADGGLVVSEEAETVLVASPSPRMNESLLLIPREHAADLNGVSRRSWAVAMQQAVRALPDADFNFWLVQQPRAGAHWYVEFAPRTSILAGVELALGIGVAIVDPLDAAQRARDRMLATAAR